MNLRRVGRIARWEVFRSAGTVDRKTLLVLVGIALVVGLVGVSVVDQGAGLEDDIYTLGAPDESPYVAVAAESPQFTVTETTIGEFHRGESSADVFSSRSGSLVSDGSPTGDAAREAFRDAIDRYNDARMQVEADQAAAYPVSVSLQYQQLEPPAEGDTDGTSTDGDGTGGDDSSGTDGTPVDGGESTGGDEGSGGAGSGSGSGSDDASSPHIPDGGGDSLGEGVTAGTPDSISPPFPFESLVLAFLFVVPMNVVIQAYGSTIMDERIKRRGELLLVSPASRYEIVAGKTLPYLLCLCAIVLVLARVIGGSAVSVLAAVPIALVFLATTFVGALFARSFKELTFVTVTISVFVTTYTFVPAIFADVTPIALISPLTLIVTDLQGQGVGLGEYLFSTGPFYLTGTVLFVLGIGVYREEDLFTQKPIPAKAVDAVASRVRSYWSVPLLSILFVPFVFVAELLAVALLFALPVSVSLPILFVTIAAIEELAKSVHVYAGFARSRFEASRRTGVVLGTLAGAGFFVGEKVTHVVQFVGIPDLEIGQAAFGPSLEADPIVLVALFVAPLALHVLTAVLSAVGASRGRSGYAVGFVVATLVHAAYNVGVIALVP